MAKTLEMNFDTEFSGSAKITVRNPKDTLTPTEIKAAMDQIVLADAFISTTGKLVSPKSARYIDRTTADIELP